MLREDAKRESRVTAVVAISAFGDADTPAPVLSPPPAHILPQPHHPLKWADKFP